MSVFFYGASLYYKRRITDERRPSPALIQRIMTDSSSKSDSSVGLKTILDYTLYSFPTSIPFIPGLPTRKIKFRLQKPIAPALSLYIGKELSNLSFCHVCR